MMNAVLVIALAIAAKPYTIIDLSALERNSAWEEIISHLEDIPPAERDAEWQRISEKAALGYTAALAKARDTYAAFLAVQELGRRHPHLMKLPEFTEKRAAVGLTAIESCFRQTWSGGECVELLLGFVDADPDNSELALRAAKLVRRSQNAYVAVPFFQRATGGEKNAKACLDEDLRLAVIAGLGLPEDDRLRAVLGGARRSCRR
jgi:hypothetical protein